MTTGYLHRARLLAGLIGASALPLQAAGAIAEIRFVPNVADQFNALTVRPDAMGFYRGDSPDPTSCKHYQGIVRLDAADGTPYFYVTRSGNIPPIPSAPDALACGEVIGSDDPGNLLVVRMDSRDKFGERLRSNRIHRVLYQTRTPPDTQDRVVTHFTFDGTGEWPSYGHPGSMQAVGDMVAMALEAPYDASLPETAVLFFDASNREAPRVTSVFPLDVGVLAGLVGLTPLPDGRYLMVVTGGKNDMLWFYESDPTRLDGSTDLADPELGWTMVDTWSEAEDGADLGADWPNDGGAAHQTLNFLREGGADGPLYLAGARGKIGFGEDWLDLYRVDRVDGQIKLIHVSSGHKNSHPALDPSVISPELNTASFAAGSTFYVSRSGELIFYATEHDNDGPFPGEIPGTPCGPCGSVKMGEWRHIAMVRPGSSTYLPSARVEGPRMVDEGQDLELVAEGVPAITRAWLQLWAGDNFSGRYLVMDYDDRLKDNFEDFKDLDGSDFDLHLGFDNEPSSMLAYAPVGCTIRVNDDDIGFGETPADDPGEYTRTLPGTGTLFSAPHLSQVRNNADTGSIDEELTSAQFFPDCDELYAQPVTISWDLEDDGQYDVLGETATLSGSDTDGPEVRHVRVRASHGNRATAALTPITVRNVPPRIRTLQLLDGLGQEIGWHVPFALAGLPVTFKATFTDPGRLDRQSAAVLWGDGTISYDGEFDQFQDGYDSGSGSLADTHTYAAGEYLITLQVEDDDGGSDEASTLLTVVEAEAAINRVIAIVSTIISAEPSPEVAEALNDVLRALEGSNDGSASNGAIDKLEADNVQAALVKLASALGGLDASEQAGAGDLTLLKNLLMLVIQQLET